MILIVFIVPKTLVLLIIILQVPLENTEFPVHKVIKTQQMSEDNLEGIRMMNSAARFTNP